MTKLEQAIAIIENGARIHRDWIDYLKSRPDDAQAVALAGSIGHHEKWIRDYDLVLEVLKEKVAK